MPRLSRTDISPLLARQETVLNPVEKVNQKTFLGVTWAFTVLSLAFLVFRITVRIRAYRRLQVDDYLVLAAWLMLLVSAIIWQLKAHVLYLQYDVTSGKAKFDMDFIETYGTLLPQITTFSILFYTCLWSIKFSFLFFFRKLGMGTNVRAHTIWWWVVCGLTLVGWVACIADFDYKCSVSSTTYILAECPLAGPVKFQARTFYANMAVDVFTDILIISIPITVLRKVQIPLKKKAALFGIFSVTVLIMIVSVIRVTLVKGTQTRLQQASIDWLYFWSNVEMGVAIIVACIASFRQLFVSKTHQAQAAGEKQQTARSRFFANLFSRFTRLTSRNTSKGAFDPPWSNDPLETKASSDSRSRIAAMASVRVDKTFDVLSGPSPPVVYAPNQIYVSDQAILRE